MKKKIIIWSLTLLTLFLFLIIVLPKQGESSKSCFVGYSEYAIVNYDMRVSETQYKNFLDQLATYDLNFVNIWSMGYCNWEYNGQEGNGPPRSCPGFIELMPYKRSGSGGKYNLTDFDPAFFTRLKNFISYAASKGIVVEITLFDSWGLKHTGEWSWHPWDCNYNVNGRICGYDCGSFFDLTDSVLIDIQKKYTQKVVYETKSYNNVIYEIMNEPLLCGPSESQAKEWHKKVAEWIREAKPDAQIVINDDNKIISYFSNYNLISPHYGSWGDGSSNTWIPSLITSLSSYGKHIIIDDDGCIWANLRKSPSNQQAWSTTAINNGASYTHLQDDLYCDYFIIDTNVLNALKVVAQECTSFPFTPPSGCTDGTSNGQCSSTKPKYCSSGSLINKCSFCGCPAGNTCQADGSCSSGGTGGIKIHQTWACGSGFPACTTQSLGICSPQPYLSMDNNQYTLNFNAPKAAAYKCTITAVANHFDYPAGGPQETNEVTEIALNDKAVGRTLDTACPPGGVSEPPPDPCGQYGDVYACNSVSGCDWRYGAPGCGTAENCQELNNEWHCDLRVCYWTGSGTIPCKGLKAEGTAWQNPQTCSQWDGNQAVCNDYTQHKGLVCCYNAQSSKCLVDPCPTWYKTRVENGYNEWTTNRGLSPTQAEDVLEKHCEGVNSGYNDDYYVLQPPGLCQWDSDWDNGNFEFPCACASNFENTGRTDYLHGTRSGGSGN